MTKLPTTPKVNWMQRWAVCTRASASAVDHSGTSRPDNGCLASLCCGQTGEERDWKSRPVRSADVSVSETMSCCFVLL